MFNPASPIESSVFSGKREKQSPGFVCDPDVANRLKSSAQSYGGLATWQLIQVEKLVEKNLFENIRIKTLANLAGLSEAYFYSAFRRSTGQTPHAFITQRRIEHAPTLMILALDDGEIMPPIINRPPWQVMGALYNPRMLAQD
jgi:hypothetical protein